MGDAHLGAELADEKAPGFQGQQCLPEVDPASGCRYYHFQQLESLLAADIWLQKI